MERRIVAQAVAVASLLLALGLVGCKSTGSGTGSGQQSGQIEGSEFEEGAGGSQTVPEGQSGLDAVYFDYDQYKIRSDGSTALRGNAKTITGSGWSNVQIQGFCDERGSEEYNLALGERRANAVKRYLVDLGVPSAKLSTVSFGEARPAVPGHSESAYRYNRRAEFVVR